MKGFHRCGRGIRLQEPAMTTAKNAANSIVGKTTRTRPRECHFEHQVFDLR